MVIYAQPFIANRYRNRLKDCEKFQMVTASYTTVNSNRNTLRSLNNGFPFTKIARLIDISISNMFSIRIINQYILYL